MKINIQAKNIELTDSIKEYVEKKITNLEKIIQSMQENTEPIVDFEVGRSTNHHKSGFIFHANCLINTNGKKFYSSADEEDLFLAIDNVRESLFLKISKEKDKKQTLFKRGALSVKKMMKGLSKRNPLTGKY